MQISWKDVLRTFWSGNVFTAPVRSKRLRHDRRRIVGSVAAEIEKLESRTLLTVTFHGGALLSTVQAQAVYLGSDWGTNSSLQSQKGQLDQFVSTIVQSPYMDMLNQAGYGVSRGTASAGELDNLTLNKSANITDSQISTDLQAAISSGQVQAPTANRLYIVYVEPGVVVQDGTSTSTTSFLGYHGAFAGQDASGNAVDIHYAVIPYPGSPNPSASSQSFSSNLNEMTAVTSHELAEAVTDPNVNYKTLGWYDDQRNGEIADLAEGYYATVSGYEVQDVVNQNDQTISPGAGTGTGSTGLTAPILTASAASSTKAQLSWTAVSGTQGYRIYEVIGSQAVLLGTVSATTTAVQVTGLTAGSTDSFKVEAFNNTSVADSNVVGVTLPAAPQPLAVPIVAVSNVTTTTAVLSWNGVSSAQGYRIFYWNGYQRVLLGTVGANTTSVEITGMTAGTSAYFQVEAFNSTQVADSAWVAVNTPVFSALASGLHAVQQPTSQWFDDVDWNHLRRSH